MISNEQILPVGVYCKFGMDAQDAGTSCRRPLFHVFSRHQCLGAFFCGVAS